MKEPQKGSNGRPPSQLSSDLLHIRIFVFEPQLWIVSGFDSFRPYNYAVILLTLEITLAIDTSIVLSKRFIERNTDPGGFMQAWQGRNGANEAYCASTGWLVGETATGVYFDTCMRRQQSRHFNSAQVFSLDDRTERVRESLPPSLVSFHMFLTFCSCFSGAVGSKRPI